MTCAKRGEKLLAKVGNEYWVVYFVRHDHDNRRIIHVAWPGTRHVSRVPRRILRRPRKRRQTHP